MGKKKLLKLLFTTILAIIITSSFTLGILNISNKIRKEVLSITSFQWIQADWSQGIGTSTSNQYQSATNINDSQPGQISIIQKADWCDNSVCNENWTKRKKITITNNDTAQTDYQVNLKINYESSMNTDFSDLRFTNLNGNNLSYWIYTKNDGVDADIWVKIDNLPVGDTEIYMYYGNSNATSTSNGEDTFIFFDDFNDNSIDTSKWNEIDPNNEIDESNGTLNFNRSTNGAWNKGVIAQTALSRANLSFEVDYEWTQNNPLYDAIMYGWHDNTTNPSYQYLVYAFYNPGTGSANTVGATVYEDGSHRSGVTGSWTVNTQYQIRVRMKDSGGAFYEQSTDGGNTWVTNYNSSYSTESNLHPSWSFYSGHHKYDNARVRKWMNTEPTYVFDLEETLYETSAELISNIFQIDDTTINWGNLSYTSSGNGTLEIRARTASDASMSDAVAFIGCNPISNNTDLSDNNCVEDNKPYIQYKVNFTGDGTDTPFLTEVKIVGEKGTEDPPPEEDSNTNNSSNNSNNNNNTSNNSTPQIIKVEVDKTDSASQNTKDNKPQIINVTNKLPNNYNAKTRENSFLNFLANFGILLFFVNGFFFILIQILLLYKYKVNIQTASLRYKKLDKENLIKNLSDIEQFTNIKTKHQRVLLRFFQILMFIGLILSIASIIVQI